MRSFASRILTALAFLFLLAATSLAAELVALSPPSWDHYVPEGKEVDAVYGDFVLANNQILAVVAHPRRGRNANMTVREVGGCLIDLTRRDRQSDQLSAFYPGAGLRELRFGGIEVEAPEVYEAAELDRVFVKARRVVLRLVAVPREGQPDVMVSYALEDGWPYVLVATRLSNPGREPIEAELVDGIRADRSFQFSPPGASGLFWAYDPHFGQAYGVVPDRREVLALAGRQVLLRYPDREGRVTVRLVPGESFWLVRRVVPGADLFAVRRVASQLWGDPDRSVRLLVKDTAGRPIDEADVALVREGKRRAWGRTDAEGRIDIATGDQAGTLEVGSPAHGKTSLAIARDTPAELSTVLPEAGVVVARITDERGEPIACKVQFRGRDGTVTPDFGPDSGEHAVRNLYYSHDGQFRRVLPPGSYDVVVSHGPEYDVISVQIDVVRGKESPLEGTLVHSVKTDGWISADFHSHASPSGDNTASQLGRVLNLLCEHVEFAPCTEHNRLSTYVPHLKRLGAERRMGTCVGIELTGSPLPLNHQNAFPLVPHPRTQDNSAPTPDADPATQIERLALWDAGAEKLVQVNHPDIGWMFRDRDGNGEPDAGFTGMFGHIDVIEVHPPHLIFEGPSVTRDTRTANNTIVNWLQLLNQGRRIPGVVNTDAHYNFHGSGWLRNYLKSPTDDPAKIRPLDVVHAAERGHVVMTTGPFLEVALQDGEKPPAIPGDDLALNGGEATLKVRVQCPNWFDVDRVQVFLNGRPDEQLNFTRRRTPELFGKATIKFDREIPLRLERDTHVIVAAIGVSSQLGPVMGPDHEMDKPVAVSNPIFVDADGGGFRANGDTLGKLPVKAQ
jgi:hypothetical protein